MACRLGGRKIRSFSGGCPPADWSLCTNRRCLFRRTYKNDKITARQIVIAPAATVIPTISPVVRLGALGGGVEVGVGKAETNGTETDGTETDGTENEGEEEPMSTLKRSSNKVRFGCYLESQ